MKKRLLASLLSATVLLSMTPMAFADEETVGEDLTGTAQVETVDETVPQVDEDENVPVEMVSRITSDGGNLASGDYVLERNVTLVGNNLTVPAGETVTIDLNGHTLTGDGASSVILVYGTLTLKDSTATDEEDDSATAAGVSNNGNTYSTTYTSGAAEDETVGVVYTYRTYTSGAITGGQGSGEVVRESGKTGGGGVYMGLTGHFVMESGTITGNKAGDGTGIYEEGGGVMVDGTEDSTAGGSFEMLGGAISGNYVNNCAGGVSIAGNFLMKGGVVSGNTSATSGSGVRIYGTALSAEIKGGYICDNVSGKNAGALYTQRELTVSDAVLIGNKGNDVAVLGAAVLSRGGDVTLNHVSVIGNSTPGSGGGVYVDKGALTVTDSQIAHNSAEERGGGIYITTGSLTITDSKIESNQAESYGGGIYAEGTLSVTNSEINRNTANSCGGGVYVKSDDIKLSGSKVIGNEVAATAFNEKGDATDGYGGGIFMNGNGTSSLTACEISGNKAVKFGGGIYTMGKIP